MSTRTPWFGNATALQEATAALVNSGAAGIIGWSAPVTADVTGITTEADLTGYTTGAVTIPANRLIVVVAFVPRVLSSVDDDSANLHIYRDSTQIQAAYADVGPGSGGRGQSAIALAPQWGLAAGSYTFKARGSRAAGSGTLEFRAGSGVPGFIIVIDGGSTT